MFATIHAFFESIIAYLHQNPHMGSLLAFLIAFAEALPIIGTVIPGSVTMTAMGALIGAGVLPGTRTILWAIFGAFVGDFIGYGIGYYFQDNLIRVWPFRKYPNLLEKGEKFFQQHGGKSIIFGRFIGPARSAVPLIAGLLRMHWLRFGFAALPSAALWAFLYMTPGILLGALSLEISPAKTTEFVLIGLASIVILWLIFWSVQFFFRQLVGFINRKIDQLWSWLNQHHSSQWFIRLITNKENPKDHHQLTLSLFSMIFMVFFLILFFQIKDNGILTHLNQPVFHMLQSFRTVYWDNFFVFITNLSYTEVSILCGFVFVLLLAVIRQWRPCLHLLGLLLVATAMTLFFKKFIYHSPRPDGFVFVKGDSSFPSGHEIMAFCVFGFTAFLIGQRFENTRKITYTITSIYLILLAFSRLYLGAHWLTDVVGSVFLSLSLLFACLVSYKRHALNIRLKSTSAKTFIWVLILAFVPIITLSSILNFSKTKNQTTPIFSVHYISTQTWWNESSEYLPLYRNNRFGLPREPFNLQWVGDLEKIKQYLISQGWIENKEELSLKSTIKRIASKEPQYHLQPLPALYLREKPMLSMIKFLPDHEGIFVLRLWHSAIILTDSDQSLWIGSIFLQFSPPKLLSFHHQNLHSFKFENNLIEMLGNLPHRKTKILTIPKEKQPKAIADLNWNGEILLIQD